MNLDDLLTRLLGTLSSIRNGGERATCLSNLHQIGLGTAIYTSDELAERDPGAARFLLGRTVDSVVAARNSSPSTEEWLMSPFFEKPW